MYLLINRHPIYYPAYCLQLKRRFDCVELTWGIMQINQILGHEQLNAIVGVRHILEPISEGNSPEELVRNTQVLSLHSDAYVIDYWDEPLVLKNENWSGKLLIDFLNKTTTLMDVFLLKGPHVLSFL